MLKWIGIIILGALMVANASGATLTVDDSGGADYTSIQAAVDNASNGDTIVVRAGTYIENVDILYKSLNVVGDGADVTIVNAYDPDDHVFYVTSDTTNISGLTVTGATGSSWRAGIYLYHSDSSKIENVNAIKNNHGIRLDQSNYNNIINNNASDNNIGISIYLSNNNILNINNASDNLLDGITSYGLGTYDTNNNLITGNYVWNNRDGISLVDISNNSIIGNNVSNNIRGISLNGGNNNTLNDNKLKNNGLIIFESYNNNIEDNFINNKPLVYLEDVQDKYISLAGQVILINCRNITVENSNLSYATVGITLTSTSHSLINGNVVKGLNPDDSGIILGDSDNNTIINNNLSNNRNGVSVSSSNNNTISDNNASGNNYAGLHLVSFNFNNISHNSISNNRFGIRLDYSNDNIIIDNNASDNYISVLLAFSNNNSITNNNAFNNNLGIYLQQFSNNNIIAGNTIKNQGNNYAITLYDSSENNIYNNILNNSNNVGFSGTVYNNTWSISKTVGLNIIGGPYLGGNFWAKPDGTGFSQTCTDADGDGMCDTNYTFAQNLDYLPLSLNFTPSTIPLSSIGYSALVATGQNTFVESSSGSFGLLLKGETETISNSVVLNNTGDLSAKVEARFNDNIGGVFGLISGANVLNATNFALGQTGSLIPLDYNGVDVQIATAPQGQTALDARLGVPSEQVAGDYSGTVVLTFSNNV